MRAFALIKKIIGVNEMVSRSMDWIRQARRNLASALANCEKELYEETCFESHQAAEKAIKGLLSHFHRERRGHSITFIILDAGIDVPAEIKNCASILDKHYIPSRYPDVYDEGAPMDYYTKEDAEKCIRCAETILKWVESIVRGAK